MFTTYINGVESHLTFERLIGLQSLRKSVTLMQFTLGAVACAGGVCEITF